MFKLSEKSFKKYLLSSNGIIFLENIIAQILHLDYAVVHNNLIIDKTLEFIKHKRPHCVVVIFQSNIFVIYKNNSYISKFKKNNEKIIYYLSKKYNNYLIYNINFNDF